MQKLISKLVGLATATLALSLISLPAQAETGLGGGANFQPGAVFPFIAGINSSIRTGFFVQNLGKETAILELGESGVEGIELVPVRKGELTLEGKKATEIFFDIKVADFVPPGDYPMILSIKQVNIPAPQPGQTAYAPGISGSAVIRVSGTNATVIIEPINSDDLSPAVGNITLRYLPKEGRPVEIARKTGKRLEKRVIEGKYSAEFSIEGLVQEQVEFRVKTGETKTVQIEIEGVRFLLAVAKERNESNGGLSSVDLAVAIRNQLKRLDGPINFKVQVFKNDELIEVTKISSLAELPVGNTEQKTNYTPPGGFSPGTWVFNFVVTGPGFKVESFDDPQIVVEGFPIWMLVLILLLVAGLMRYLWKKKLTRAQRDRIKVTIQRPIGLAWPQLAKIANRTLLLIAGLLNQLGKVFRNSGLLSKTLGNLGKNLGWLKRKFKKTEITEEPKPTVSEPIAPIPQISPQAPYRATNMDQF